jgi:phosphoglycerate dehydrogenase-like enzyme
MITSNKPGDPLHVLVTLDFPPSFLERVRSVSDRIVLAHHPVADADDEVPPAALESAEVMYTSDVLPGPANAPCLRWAQLDTSGIDHLRESPLWDSDVVLTTLGGVSPNSLAGWVMTMILAHAHRLRETEKLALGHTWPSREERWNLLMPRDLRRSTVCIVGYGRIGREIARLCQTFGMRVLAVRRDPTAVGVGRFGDQGDLDGVVVVGVDELDNVLAESDYVALTVPLTDQTHGMMAATQFAAMKSGAVLVNASRGGVVDEQALFAALDCGRLDLVASDVFAHEPLPPESPWWSHPRSVVTPHIAGFAPDYVDVVGNLFTENLRRYLAEGPLLNVADRVRGY